MQNMNIKSLNEETDLWLNEFCPARNSNVSQANGVSANSTINKISQKQIDYKFQENLIKDYQIYPKLPTLSTIKNKIKINKNIFLLFENTDMVSLYCNTDDFVNKKRKLNYEKDECNSENQKQFLLEQINKLKSVTAIHERKEQSTFFRFLDAFDLFKPIKIYENNKEYLHLFDAIKKFSMFSDDYEHRDHAILGGLCILKKFHDDPECIYRENKGDIYYQLGCFYLSGHNYVEYKKGVACNPNRASYFFIKAVMEGHKKLLDEMIDGFDLNFRLKFFKTLQLSIKEGKNLKYNNCIHLQFLVFMIQFYLTHFENKDFNNESSLFKMSFLKIFVVLQNSENEKDEEIISLRALAIKLLDDQRIARLLQPNQLMYIKSQKSNCLQTLESSTQDDNSDLLKIYI